MDRTADLQAVRDRELIKELKYRYCYAIDSGDVEGFVDVFTEDGVIDYATYEDTFEGHEEIRGFIEGHVTDAEVMTHMAVNPVIDVDGDAATGRWYYVYIAIDGPDTTFGQGAYDETYRRTEDGWRIATLRTDRRISSWRETVL